MNIEVNKVYTFKLNSGEELISKVIGKNTDALGSYYELSEPVSVAPGPQGMGLVPSMFTANHKESVRLNTNSISLVGPTDESVQTKYIQATTGITVPDKKLILG